ncbi:MAG: glycosyltransferase family 39 protein [Candidatus Methanomethylicia archaeon]
MPPHLGNDEISIASDAYSIINTGRDLTGKKLPLSFKSHNTYKAPLYIYLAAPLVKIFGNNELSVRLPSVILGSLTLLIIFFLVKRITNNEFVAFFSAFLLAISPWHVYVSRVAYEANIALFFLTLGLLIFFSAKSNRVLFFSSLSLALSLYGYHTEWVFVPLLMLFLFVFPGKFSRLRLLYYWLVPFLLFILPLFLDWWINRTNSRAFTEFIGNDFELNNRLASVGNFLNRIFIVFTFWLDKYLSYIDLRSMFTKGLDISPSYQSATFGLFNILSLPFFLLGIYCFFCEEEVTKLSKRLLFFWFFIGPLVPSFTEGSFNYIRNLVSIFPWLILISYGIFFLLLKTRSYLVVLIIAFALLINFALFYSYYIKRFQYHFAENWQYGYRQIANFINANQDKYQKIVIDPHFGVVNNNFIGVPMLYILYFNKINPSDFILKKEEIAGGGIRYGNYFVRDISWTNEKLEKNTLYVVSYHSNPLTNQPLKKVYSVDLPDGREAFKLYESY